MAGELDYKITVDMGSVLERFGERIPNLTRRSIVQAMRTIAGRLESEVAANITRMFDQSTSSQRPPHLHLIDSLLARVYEDGDFVVAEVSIDLNENPYARILEMGGVISPHRILPVRGIALAFPTATLKAFGEAETTMSEFILAREVNHPGAHIPAYFYMATALIEEAKQAANDLELTVARVVMQSE